MVLLGWSIFVQKQLKIQNKIDIFCISKRGCNLISLNDFNDSKFTKNMSKGVKVIFISEKKIREEVFFFYIYRLNILKTNRSNKITV